MARDRAQTPLPIDDLIPEVIEQLRQSSSLVLEAATGAGKTTRIPPAIDRAGLARGKRIVMLEPRRVAARAAARRIAQENGWRLGEEVGYHIRFDRKVSARTRIVVCTEGVVVRMLQDDPLLEDIGVLIFDELHERSLNSDLALAMARRVQADVRPDLLIVAMSATLDRAPLANFLGDCPVVTSSGRSFPVEVEHVKLVTDEPLDARVVAGVRLLLERPMPHDTYAHDLLVFLPGVGEIRRAAERLTPLVKHHDLALHTLYGDLPAEQQDAVLRRGNRRKLVLATNVAETSITIDGVGIVIDSGLARTIRFDPGTGLDRLVLGRISRASATQRTGRAGRQGRGRCLRLWTRHDHRSLPERDTPEIQRVDLAGTVLQLLAWGESDPNDFPWLEAPTRDTVRRAEALLRRLGAVGDAGVTPRGQAMARLPLHPRLARLVVAGHADGVLRKAARLAAMLGERDVVRHGRGKGPPVATTQGDSDLLDRLDAIDRVTRSGWGETAIGPVDRGRAAYVNRVGRQIEANATRLLPRPRDQKQEPASDPDLLLRAILAAYPDRVARRRAKDDDRGVMVGGRGVRISPASCVRSAPLFVCVELGEHRHAAGKTPREALVRMASAVEPSWLDTRLVETRDVVTFDEARTRVVGARRTTYLDLVLDSVETPVTDQDTADRVLIDAARERLHEALPLDDDSVVTFRTRLQCLVDWMPELDLPRFDDEAMKDTVLPLIVPGKRSFAELHRAPLLDTLRGLLAFGQLQTLDREVPESLPIPTGQRVRLHYRDDGPPVLAARIQQLFGLRETPRIAGGRVPVLLHLLAPNQRPQQITQDLESFWSTTYQAVRKELAGRYPRHAWPEDPWNAQPERRPRRRRS